MVTFEECKPNINEAFHKALSANDEALFKKYLSQALEMFKNRTGITPVTPRTVDLNWCILPLAWIVEFCVSTGTSTNLSDNIRSAIELHWKEAQKILDNHRVKRANAKSSYGQITGIIKL